MRRQVNHIPIIHDSKTQQTSHMLCIKMAACHIAGKISIEHAINFLSKYISIEM